MISFWWSSDVYSVLVGGWTDEQAKFKKLVILIRSIFKGS